MFQLLVVCEFGKNKVFTLNMDSTAHGAFVGPN